MWSHLGEALLLLAPTATGLVWLAIVMVFAIAAPAVGWAALAGWGLAGRERRAFDEVGARLGLRSEAGREPGEGRVLVGVHRGVPVRVSQTARRAGRRRVRFVTFEAAGVLPGVQLAARRALDGPLAHAGKRPVKVGDAGFDAEIVASGDVAEVRASLGEAARATVRELVRDEGEGGAPARWGPILNLRRVEVADGRVMVHRRGRMTDADAIVAELDRAAGAAEALGVREVGEALARVAAEDPAPGARLGALLTLAAREGAAPGEQDRRGDVLRRALADADPTIRARVAALLGDVAALQAAAADPEVPDEEKRRVRAALQAKGVLGAGRVALVEGGGELGLADVAGGVAEGALSAERTATAAERDAREAARAEVQRAIEAGVRSAGGGRGAGGGSGARGG